jgi:hypothetical protein
MPRPKGFKLSDEQKQKMREGRKAARLGIIKVPELKGRPNLYITGNEEDSYGYSQAIRNALRPLSQYKLCDKIIKEIRDPAIWKNLSIVKSILEKYFTLVSLDGKAIPKAVTVKKTRKYTMSEEHKAKVIAGRKAYCERKRNEL